VVAYLTQGLVLGLAAGFAPGPLLALVIAQTLSHGMREGVKVAFAPLVTDVPIVALAVLLVAPVAAFQTGLGVLSLIGAAFVFYLACDSFRTVRRRDDSATGLPRSLGRGALVNALNPHPYLFWLAVGAPTVIKAWRVSPLAAAAFLLGFYASLTGAKVVVAYGTDRSKAFLTQRLYAYLMRGLGVLLTLFALLLLRDGLRLLFEAS